MTQRLFGKYNVTKANGEPTDPNAQYFVLRIDTDPAARAALAIYSQWQEEPFRSQIRQWLAEVTDKSNKAGVIIGGGQVLPIDRPEDYDPSFVSKPVTSRSLTTDPDDPRLIRGINDDTPRPQNDVYLVLSEEERAKGFVRPVRRAYQHVGVRPQYPLRDMTSDEKRRFPDFDKVEEKEHGSRYWRQADLDRAGCNEVTIISLAIAETYARSPHFYGSTYCTHCQMHRPVNEFVWTDDETVVGS